MKHFFIACLIVLLPVLSQAQSVEPRDGWQVFDTKLSYAELLERTRNAVEAAPINIVTQASASKGAKAQGIDIPGNHVIGVYRNDYARRMLKASIPAGIEAPLRLYITENPNDTATLSYKTASSVFAPYMQDGGDDLHTLSEELDAILLSIAQNATQ